MDRFRPDEEARRQYWIIPNMRLYLRLREEGFSLKAIGEITSRSPQRIGQVVKDAIERGIKPAEGKVPITKEAYEHWLATEIIPAASAAWDEALEKMKRRRRQIAHEQWLRAEERRKKGPGRKARQTAEWQKKWAEKGWI